MDTEGSNFVVYAAEHVEHKQMSDGKALYHFHFSIAIDVNFCFMITMYVCMYHVRCLSWSRSCTDLTYLG